MIDDYLKNWLKKAENDFKAAQNELEITKKRKLTDVICFHCQQAVEKYLKAFLVSKNINFKKTHNLEALLDTCKKIEPDFENLHAGDLSYYAVEVRYPDDFYTPTLKEAEESFQIAKSIKKFIIAKIKTNS